MGVIFKRSVRVMENTFKQPLFVVGMPLFVVGICIANPGFWIPGLVFMVIGFSQRSKG
jgi:hypothetical protein